MIFVVVVVKLQLERAVLIVGQIQHFGNRSGTFLL